jgi:hypothetical protein
MEKDDKLSNSECGGKVASCIKELTQHFFGLRAGGGGGGSADAVTN